MKQNSPECLGVEEVIRFLIADLGVPPLIAAWDEELQKSEEQFREWSIQNG